MKDNREQILKCLKQYKPFNEEEKENVDKTIKFVETNKNCFERTNKSGHITGSAWLLNAKKDKVLLTHHKKLNKWLQLGGHADGQSNVLKVALKEAKEESGIENIKILQSEIFDVDVHEIPENEKSKEPKHFHFDVRFIFCTNQSEFKISHESNNLKWFSIHDLENLSETSDNTFDRMINKWKNLN